MWFLYSKQRLLTQHIREFLQVWPGPLPNFWVGPGDEAISHACATNEVWKVWEGRQNVRWKSLKMRARFWTPQNAKIWSFIKMTTHFICFARCCCSLSDSLFLTRTSQRWGCIYTLSSPFSCQAPSSFFFAPITTFAIWRHDNETTSAATALRNICIP